MPPTIFPPRDAANCRIPTPPPNSEHSLTPPPPMISERFRLSTGARRDRGLRYSSQSFVAGMCQYATRVACPSAHRSIQATGTDDSTHDSRRAPIETWHRVCTPIVCRIGSRARGGATVSMPNEFDEYLAELREGVCSRCIARPPGYPPCSPHRIGCGIEQHVPQLVEICRTTESCLMDPYIDQLHDTICKDCANRTEPSCPCPLD